MVLGFRHRNESDERQARNKTYDLNREFIKRFQALHGTILCKELLGGVDLSAPEGRQEAADRKLFTTVCPTFVRDAALILETMA